MSALPMDGWAQAVSPERQKELREQFLKGKELVDQKRFLGALDIFKTILSEDPQARGSLLMSGLTYNQLLMFSNASEYFDRFLVLEPNHVAGNMGALKAYQSAGLKDKAARARTKLLQLQREGQDPRFKILLSYEREVRKLPNEQVISVQEAFPDKESFIWKLLLLKNKMTMIERAIEWKRADDSQKEIMGVELTTELWILGEPIYQSGELKEYKIRKIHTGPLLYEQAAQMGFDILAGLDQ
ncbi:MAG: hypothetical protein AAF571_13545 [Verrucomicrobiota bacterium]